MTIRSVVQVFVPFRLEGADVDDFIETLTETPKGSAIELHVEDQTPVAFPRRDVTFELPHPDEVLETSEPAPPEFPPFKGRASLSVRRPNGESDHHQSQTVTAERIEALLADRIMLPRELRFNQSFLRAYLAREGMDQGQFGDLVGVTGCSVSNWCTGATRPLVPNLRAVSEATGLSMDKLLLGS